MKEENYSKPEIPEYNVYLILILLTRYEGGGLC